ncbi:hypothetical protein Pmar_PMAR012685 [Perkinsus marinus ATCC 50983]|uniref:Uncharacterized protein n=1 Tax=Perkinsus marinus (strain ATCC 50983 / TXsc) TaxID=423536 RepID=C5K812_PERM5|nr:hypothetical protein Pmar_PMAR012685 [Perkinsus marinus ATCC 50983]EER19697.1 hypothetical protein Pmar_PMAR012685 [Perkinsus marinus ATCC 50983]|eukprot:XP_002787901.1 hypothetical protein Pmar_PMAR012685 [Perkinsus marinus ATCC 50983]
MISYAFAGVPPFTILTPEVTQSVSEKFEEASTKVQERVHGFKKTATGQRISAAATSASDYMSAAFDSFLNRTEVLVDSMLPPIEEPVDMAHTESDATTTSPSSSSTKEQKSSVEAAGQHQRELARALGLAGTVCSRVYTRADIYVIEPCREYMSDIWEFWSFLWSGAKEMCGSLWASIKTWIVTKYTELKEKAPGMWQYVRALVMDNWTSMKNAASCAFAKAKECSLYIKDKAVMAWNKALTPERKHSLEEMYKTVSVKAYEYCNLAKVSIIKSAKSVYTYLVTIFTWDNFNRGVASVSAAFACPWVCGAAATAKDEKA